MAEPATRKLPRDLAGYWRMEAMNVVLVPGLALGLGWPRVLLEAVAITLAVLATAGFLIVGTAYWRGVERRARLQERDSIQAALRLADRLEKPVLALSFLGAIAWIAAFTASGWSQAVIAAALLLVLTWLEYINYYRWQLQIFDHAADWRRTLATRRLKRAHMGRELARMRQLSREGVAN